MRFASNAILGLDILIILRMKYCDVRCLLCPELIMLEDLSLILLSSGLRIRGFEADFPTEMRLLDLGDKYLWYLSFRLCRLLTTLTGRRLPNRSSSSTGA